VTTVNEWVEIRSVRLGSRDNFISNIDEFVFSSFIYFKPVKTFENGGSV